MILAPRWSFTKRLMVSMWPFVVLPVVYVALLIPQLVGAGIIALDFTLSGIAALLGTPAGALLGWAHFLAFDLFVGRWVYLDSRERNLSSILVSIALVFVFLSGPFGLLLYLAVRGRK